MTTETSRPMGTFESSPIIADKAKDAQEILSRTYKPERFTLKRKRKILIYGRLNAWIFDVIPTSARITS